MFNANEKETPFFLVAKLVYVLGMNELQRSIWLLSTLVNAENNQAMLDTKGKRAIATKIYH